ncbi:hypothetical protein KR222_003287 [Zaprionus bogoriensis]|nr:hypothetical protein KR222_003287 [Zaprionus bogoriensis]
MQTLTRSGGAAEATPSTTTKLTTSSPNNNNNNNNLTLAIMSRRTTRTNTLATAKFHKRRRSRQRSQRSSSSSSRSTAATSTVRTTTAATTASRRCYPSWSRRGAYLTLLLLTTTCSLCTVASASASVAASDSGSDTGATTASAAISSASPSGGAFFAVHNSPCAPQHWWDSLQDRCRPCTRCQGETIPLRPCQLHKDTVCSSVYDLDFNWAGLAKTEPNWKERRKSSEYDPFDQPTQLQHLTQEQLQQLHEEAAAVLPLDWQTGALFIAVPACLLFFSVAACILIHHMRQWRRMERRLDQDVEELSTKLMAKLAEVQSLDGGTFFIGNADALRGLPVSAVTSTSTAQSGLFQPQHVLLPVEKHAKHQERRILKTLQPGNVYIEENNGIGGLGVGFGPKG